MSLKEADRFSNKSEDNFLFKEKLKPELEIITPRDLIDTFDPENSSDNQKHLQELLLELSEKEINKINNAYEFRIKELWELKYRNIAWEDFKKERTENNLSGFWVRDKTTGEIRRTLKKEEFYEVFTSRLYPLMTRQEIKKMRDTKITFLGLSTNSPVLIDSVKVGLGNFIAIDPDEVNLSNTTRMRATDADVGEKKGLVLAREVVKINPYVDFKILIPPKENPLSEEEIRLIMKVTDLTIEMVDHFPTKLAVRKIAREENKIVLMGTGTGWRPLIDVETADNTFFNDPSLSEDDFNMIISTENPLVRTAKAIKVIGKENIPDRQMINFILAGKGKLGYWSQLGPTADGTTFGMVFAIIQLANNRKVRPKTAIDLPEIMLEKESQEKNDEALFTELCRDFPDFFNKSQGNLKNAVDTYYKEMFEDKI